ncbi:MAG: RNA-binding protein [Anaerolineae bacterium]|nr:RNA-binding protein [Anaerolineae bacterium]
MGKKMYVGNLSYETTEESLRTLFAEFGQVESVNLITDRYSGRSRGFAFVEMETEEAAQTAVAALKSKILDGREIDVAEARPQTERRGGQRGGQRGGGRSRW